TGLRTWQQPFAFQILPPNARQLSLTVPISGLNTPGSTVSLSVQNLSAAQATAGVSATLNGLTIPVTAAFQGFVAIQIPAGFPTGPAILRIVAAGEASLPYCLQVDPLPPVISTVMNAATLGPVDASHPARIGDVLTLTVSQLGDNVATGQVRLTFSGFDYSVSQVQPVTGQSGIWQVSFQIGTNVPTGSVPLTITAPDGRTSQPIYLSVRAN
ncbi:MAG: hypothetical protein NTY38_01170, partial [Acidobacteria bacterium]|nr:hypothetical protein [Acidobacteriota bacterium]